MSLAETVVSQPQRKFSWPGDASSTNAAIARLGSSKRTPHPLLGIARQNDGAMQERGCRGQAAARLRAAGGLLELRGDRLVGPRCRCGQMPRATVGLDGA